MSITRVRNVSLGIAFGAACALASRLLAAATENALAERAKERKAAREMLAREAAEHARVATARKAAADAERAVVAAEATRTAAAEAARTAALVVPPWVPAHSLKLTTCPCCSTDADQDDSRFWASGNIRRADLARPSEVFEKLEFSYGVNLGCTRGHSLCMPCALRNIRAELLNPDMVRCPLCRALAPPLDSPVSERAVREVGGVVQFPFSSLIHREPFWP